MPTTTWPVVLSGIPEDIWNVTWSDAVFGTSLSVREMWMEDTNVCFYLKACWQYDDVKDCSETPYLNSSHTRPVHPFYVSKRFHFISMCSKTNDSFPKILYMNLFPYSEGSDKLCSFSVLQLCYNVHLSSLPFTVEIELFNRIHPTWIIVYILL